MHFSTFKLLLYSETKPECFNNRKKKVFDRKWVNITCRVKKDKRKKNPKRNFLNLIVALQSFVNKMKYILCVYEYEKIELWHLNIKGKLKLTNC